MEQTIRDLFTRDEWEIFAADADSPLAAVQDLPVCMEASADEEK